jgi:hypothetical protein
MNVLPTRRRRAVAGLVLSSAVLLAACGGGGSSKASDSTQPAGNGSDATTTTLTGISKGSGSCYTTPGQQTAKVRFVNLFTNSTYPQGGIDVYQGYGADDGCGKKLATVPYGTASDYIDVTAADQDGNWSATAYVAGSTARDHQIINQTETWKGGEQVTIVFQPGDPTSGQPPNSGGDQAFFEKDTATDSSALPAVPGKAVLAVGAGAVQYVDKDGAWVAGLVGQPQCLLGPGDTESTRTNVGGTSLIPYPVAPGSVQLALYPSIPGKCTGTPAIGPATIDATAGSRTLVLAYGPDKQNIKLLVLPVAG